MPAILDVAIGTVFIFLLFSLVVSALNEYLLSLTDQRAKFLRMGLVEIIGKSVVASGSVGAAAGRFQALLGRFRSAGGCISGVFPQSVRDILWFPFWLVKSLFTFGGLIQWKDNPPLEVAGENLLSHGLLNGFSRSENGTGTPSYIPPGAFVTALLDLVVGQGSPAALSATQIPVVRQFIADITAAQAPGAAPLTLTTYQAPVTTFLSALAPTAVAPAPGTLLARLRDRAASDLARSSLQATLQPPGVTDFPSAQKVIAKPLHAPFQAELDALVANSAANFPLFQQTLNRWFSYPDSLAALQTASVGATANLVATTVEQTAAHILAGLEKLPPGSLKTSLLSLFESAGRDVKQFKIALEGWFNGVMDRVSGWYKRFAQKWMIAIGFALAAMFNVDTIAIVRELSNNPNLARAVASQAETYYGENGRPLTPAQLREQNEQKLAAAEKAEKEFAQLRDTTAAVPAQIKAAQKQLTDAQAALKTLVDGGENEAPKLADAQKKVDDATAALQTLTAAAPPTPEQITAAKKKRDDARHEADTRQAYQSAAARLSESGLPVGWTVEQRKALGLAGWKFDPGASLKSLFDWRNYEKKATEYVHWFSTHFSTLATLSAGWFLTAIAASLGAPFWFDLLGRFVNIRAAGKAPGEKDATATPTRPPPASLDTTPGTRA